jgi:DNA-binding NarL/FixJ family response regulator
MERHRIISESTLLSEGLQHFLEIHRSARVDLVTPEDCKSGKPGDLADIRFLWIDVIREFKGLLKLSQKILRNQPELKIFVFGEFKDTQSIQSIFKTGVSGYLLSNCCTQILNEAIHTVYSGTLFVDPRLPQTFMEALLQSQNSPPLKNRLTKREKQILQLIVDEYTTHEIANKLFISFCTVETHRLHLIQKMGVKNTAGLVREAISNNLLVGYP